MKITSGMAFATTLRQVQRNMVRNNPRGAHGTDCVCFDRAVHHVLGFLG
ncbi:MAG: hypothetical protein ISP99_06220 [Pseudomonadales bacterium]|nr:hypothetical protein [Pseudomonadales bacterium]